MATPGRKYIDIEKLQKVLELLESAKSPAVLFSEDMSEMREAAQRSTELDIHSASSMIGFLLSDEYEA